jgi:hypothetical protein
VKDVITPHNVAMLFACASFALAVFCQAANLFHRGIVAQERADADRRRRERNAR